MRCGDRLRRARTLRGMTMKELGLEMHYPYKNADTRIAQYEKGPEVQKKRQLRNWPGS